MERPQSKFRFERKYNLSLKEWGPLMHNVVKSGLKIHHPPRSINNLYCDTLSRDAYFENVEGLSERKKYRIRWYGTRLGRIKPTLEIKIKQEYVNKKQSAKLPKFELQSLADIDSFYKKSLQFLEKEQLPLFYLMCNKFPLLINGYERVYYISECKTTRLTIDKNLRFYNVLTKRSTLLLDNIIV